jgi:kumamolisin
MLIKQIPLVLAVSLATAGFTLTASQDAFAASPAGVALRGYAAQGISQARIGRVDSQESVSMVVALEPRNEAQLKTLISSLNDPTSPQFGKYITPGEYTERFAPAQADYDAVAAHFQSNGFSVSRTPNRMLVRVTAPASAYRKALNVSFGRYKGNDGEYISAETDPVVPAQLAPHIAALVGLNTGIHFKPSVSIASRGSQFSSNAATGPAGGFSPQDIAKAYEIPTWLGGGEGETIALVEFDGYKAADIKAYAARFGLPDLRLKDVFIDGFTGGPQDPYSTQLEVTLDIQMIQAVAPHAKKVIVYQGYNDPVSSLDMLNRIVTDNEAKQISTSWSGLEHELLNTPGGRDYLKAENYLLQQAAAQGQAFFASSGDRGARQDPFVSFPTVDDPAGQPYAIAVGGTKLTTTATGFWAAENTWNELAIHRGASGGGVSEVWPITSAQLPAITPASGGSLSFRNVPDVSLNADPLTGYSVYEQNYAPLSPNGDGWVSVAGTSAASPLWAAYLAIVNSGRRAVGLPRIGWPAPAIYNILKSPLYPYAFHDIADGVTNGFYPSVPGYDLTSGVGTIRGLGLLAGMLLSPPSTVAAGTAPTVPVFLDRGGDTVDYLRWTAVPNATGYNIYRAISGNPLQLIKTVSASTTAYTDTGIVNDQVYDYAVASVGSWGISPLSATVTAYPTALDWIFLPDYFFQTESSVSIFWVTTVSGAPTLRWGYSSNNLDHVMNTQFGDGGFVTLTDLTPGAAIYYRVTVAGANGTIDSGVLTATP